MTERSLQVTYRKGRPFAAYLHLAHATGEKSARTVPSPDGLLVVDYAANGQPIGVEITSPHVVDEALLARCRELLGDEGVGLSEDEVDGIRRHADAMAHVLIEVFLEKRTTVH